MADLLNDAWIHFLADPQGYANWEKTKVDELSRMIGYSGMMAAAWVRS